MGSFHQAFRHGEREEIEALFKEKPPQADRFTHYRRGFAAVNQTGSWQSFFHIRSKSSMEPGAQPA